MQKPPGVRQDSPKVAGLNTNYRQSACRASLREMPNDSLTDDTFRCFGHNHLLNDCLHFGVCLLAKYF